MALIQTGMTSRSMKHAVASSTVHAEDKRNALVARHTLHFVVEVPPVLNSPPSFVPGFSEGWQYIAQAGRYQPAGEDDFVQHLERENHARRWYWGTVTRRSTGKTTVTKRYRKKALDQFASHFSPWHSAWLYDQASRDTESRDWVKRFIDQTMQERLIPQFETLAGREVIGYSVHCDTECVHVHLQSSRVVITERGNDLRPRAQKGKKQSRRSIGILSNGAGSVSRQLGIGAISKRHKNAIRLGQSLGLWVSRRGDQPTDVLLCRVLDDACWLAFGANPMLAKFISSYIKSVCPRKVQRLQGELDALQEEMDATLKAAGDDLPSSQSGQPPASQSSPPSTKQVVSSPSAQLPQLRSLV